MYFQLDVKGFLISAEYDNEDYVLKVKSLRQQLWVNVEKRYISQDPIYFHVVVKQGKLLDYLSKQTLEKGQFVLIKTDKITQAHTREKDDKKYIWISVTVEDHSQLTICQKEGDFWQSFKK